MKLTDELIKSSECVKCFKDNVDKVNSLHFTANGENLLSSSLDDSLNVYDVINGKHLQKINCKKYGVELARFTHCPSAILHSSNKYDDNIRYLSLHDNKYLRFFSGHTKKVISLAMAPNNDTFLSGSVDKTIRLWDLRTSNCQAIMNVGGRGLAAIDPEGLIFGACVSNDTCKLYDLRTYEQGPFLTFTIPSMVHQEGGSNKPEVHSIRFSPDGKMILITGTGTCVALVDSYSGKSMQQFQILGTNAGQVGVQGCFSPDSRYVMAGSPEGRVYVWRALPSTVQRVAVLQSNEGGTAAGGGSAARSSGGVSGQLNIGALEANPLYAVTALGQLQTSLWVPTAGPASIIDDTPMITD